MIETAQTPFAVRLDPALPRPRILVVQARFYTDIADELLRGCRTELEAHGAKITVRDVPGSFEIPAVIAAAERASARYDGYVTLGCVVRGETSHYDHVCTEVARGLMQLSLDHALAIGFGVLTVETLEQAWARARVIEGNKGRDAAIACLAMIGLQAELGLYPRAS